LIILEFVPPIEGLGTGGKDFDDQFGMAFDVTIMAISRVTSDKGVRVIIKLVFVIDFDIARIETAGGEVAQVIVDQFEDIEGDTIVVIGAPGHGINEASAIFMADWALVLNLQIFFGANVIEDGNHGGVGGKVTVW
jgi:hypothetical protein